MQQTSAPYLLIEILDLHCTTLVHWTCASKNIFGPSIRTGPEMASTSLLAGANIFSKKHALQKKPSTSTNHLQSARPRINAQGIGCSENFRWPKGRFARRHGCTIQRTWRQHDPGNVFFGLAKACVQPLAERESQVTQVRRNNLPCVISTVT